ncbi:guanylate-binding protein 2-like [Lingula anatina]|uniref:Guanylate-binding protein 2-like n=1 Tax=Lingula anatina TaxID=7574 RepID=A0A2R2MNH6_LINAN|nr:guanylate-binding protein 2-like [Lingula anatina]|eukprot:XP_023931765.1 guanylate-binding protein 2-like [Lingula anatina]
MSTTHQEPSSPVGLKPYMTEPQPLLTVDSNGKLQLNEDTMRTIENCTQPVVCVGVIGPARTGKSLLMNRLLGRQSGFDLGSTLDSKTKGIWAWLVPHPKDANLSLLLLDTEGLAHAADGCCDRENYIFVLTVLISGCLLYNCQGVFDAEKVDKLELIANLSQHMVDKMGSGRDTDVLQLFPALYIVVRDFTLELVMDGERCSPDEYLERCLKTKFGHNKETRTRNATKDAVKSYFPNRACFVLPRPTEEEKLSALEELGEEDLKPNFVKGVNDICDRIHKEVKPKSIQGKVFIGRVLGTLIRDCLKAFESGYIPTALSTLEALSKTECSKGIEAALEMYRASMDVLKEDFPVTEEQLVGHHYETFETVVKPEFDKYVVFDDKADGFRKLEEAIANHYKYLRKINEEDSRALCQQIVKTLHEVCVLTAFEENSYTGEYGLKRFDEDVEKVFCWFGRYSHKGPPEIVSAALEEYKTKIGDLRTTIEVNATEIARKNEEIDEQQRRAIHAGEQRKKLERNFDEFKTQVRRKEERDRRQLKELTTKLGDLRLQHKEEMLEVQRKAKWQDMEMQRANLQLQHSLEIQKERNQEQRETERNLKERMQMLKRQNQRLEVCLEQLQENDSDEDCIIM